jgi:hypothetical protein
MARHPDRGPHTIRERLVVMFRRGLLVMVDTGEPGEDFSTALSEALKTLMPRANS